MLNIADFLLKRDWHPFRKRINTTLIQGKSWSNNGDEILPLPAQSVFIEIQANEIIANSEHEAEDLKAIETLVGKGWDLVRDYDTSEWK